MEGKLFNLDYLKSISGGDAEFVNDMVQTFIANSPDELNEIKDLIANKNWQKVGEEAHRFASSLLFLGLDNLKQLAIEIENNGIQQTEVEKIPALLEQIEKGCSAVIAQLKDEFNV